MPEALPGGVGGMLTFRIDRRITYSVPEIYGTIEVRTTVSGTNPQNLLPLKDTTSILVIFIWESRPPPPPLRLLIRFRG